MLAALRADRERGSSLELEHTGTDYEARVKLSLVLKAGEADRFTIRLSCTQSAFHEFRVRWNFVGGLSSSSYGIRLQHFVPRTFSSEAGERVHNGEIDPEQSDMQPVFEGDCIEQSLNMCSMAVQAKAEFEKSAREEAVDCS
jgi:hypothetical protein